VSAPEEVRIVPPEGLPRVPPGQRVAEDWPVLHHRGTAPSAWPARWTLRLDGLVEQPTVLSLEALQGLPHLDVVADVHCVTGWSLLGRRWRGVALRDLEDLVRPRPEARFLMAHALGGWTTDLALADGRRPGVAVVWAVDGAPLPREHGGPLRLLVPHLYFWKSCKWLVQLEWMAEDRPGFWERDTPYRDLDPWHAVRPPAGAGP
jgi:DMSO/TMAO reductase YedYZ molybdopterin-dependent catalytic subunit